MTDPPASQLDPHKFRDPFVTAKGERRARVPLRALAGPRGEVFMPE